MKCPLICIAGAAMAIFAVPAYASDTIILPNGVQVPYYGQSAPSFELSVYGGYYSAYDRTSGITYYYSATGTWVGVQGSRGSPVTGLPDMPVVPRTLTLPSGATVSYNGVGVPQITEHGTGHFVFDPVTNRTFHVPAPGGSGGSSASGGGHWWGNPVTGSSSFGSSGAVSTGSTSFGGTTGGTGGAIDSSSGGNTSGGGTTDVPAPAGVLLFGLGAAAVIAARSRRKK